MKPCFIWSNGDFFERDAMKNFFETMGEAQSTKRSQSSPPRPRFEPRMTQAAAGSNPFEAMAEAQTPSPVKAKYRSAEKAAITRAMKKSDLEQKQEDQNKQLKIYNAWKRTLRQAIAARYGTDFKSLVALIRNCAPEREEGIYKFVSKAKWLLSADADTRMAVLSYIGSAFIRGQIRDGRPPFDDPIPSFDGSFKEIVTPYMKIRKLLVKE